jgi:hypothetical protein
MWLRFLVLGVAILGVGEFGLHLYHKKKSPNPDVGGHLVGPVPEEKRPGDVVVVAPSWADPWARKTLGDGVFPLRDIARPDVSRYATALEIGMLGQTSSELGEFREVSRRQVGPFLLRRLENPHPTPIVFDFVDHLAAGHAEVRVTEPDTKCPYNTHARPIAGGLGGHPTFPAARYECPGGVYFNVSETVIADQDFRPRRCIWAHPPNRGEVVLRFSDVNLGNMIRGHGGLYWIIERDKPGGPITVRVRVNGDEIGSYEHKDGDGWSLFELPLGAQAQKKNATVEFGVSAKNNMHRHFCFEADSR